ncbi:DUF4129 domain-containing protein [Rugosimonospora africana]|uniref:Protein-glutamine gamma-glutamyltransferase-like C-terminal domain-containing protein n=1 Tax=Rugosimonospora africana TaxID=556532 RepID=A0A8J3QJB0_9ACTN|nr:DUF4129 domain-containing protein [Rugosimonospora africana]GIH12000.1 hypothetical protein Raf01_01720 [Rugosimonospora africana]
MSRWWTERVAGLGDYLPLGLAALLLFVLAGLCAAALYWWPSWLPWRWWPRARTGEGRRGIRWRWPRLRWPWRRFRLRWPWRRRRAEQEPADEPTIVAGDELPDLPTEAFVSLADRLAAQGRFGEAVRERLRGIVRELVDHQVVQSRPGWTVTELAAAAGTAWPPVGAPLDAASRTFSDIWYGQRPATAVHDGQMRGYADQVHAALASTMAGAHR